MSRIYRLMPVVLLLSLSTACSVYRFPSSPYSPHYNGGFAGVHVPDAASIREAGVTWPFPRTPDAVWSSTLKIVSQYAGVLDIAEQGNGERRMLIVHGQPTFAKAPSGTNANMAVSKYLDVWLAIAVTPASDGKETSVSVAWVSPKTGNVAPPELLSVQPAPSKWAFWKNDSAAKTVPPIRPEEFRGGPTGQFDAIVSSLSEERGRLVAAQASSEDIAAQWQYVPRASINQFFYHLATQLYGPDRWREKLTEAETNGQPGSPRGGHQQGAVVNARDFAPPRVSSNAPAQVRKVRKDIEAVPQSEEHAQLLVEAGQWTSASLRRNFVVVHAPATSELLQSILDKVRNAAERSDVVTPYIIASPQINAFAMPNGDVFITSGMLEAVESQDELAIVVGHELDHLFQQDSRTFLLKRQNAVIQAQVIGIVLGIAGGVAGAVVAAPTVTATGAISQSASSQVMSNVVTNLVTTTGQLAGQHVGTTMVSGHSQESELRADRNAARYAFTAGFDVNAAPAVLVRMKKLRIEAEKRNEPVLSGFINAQPGLDERIDKLRGLIDGIRRDQ